MDLNLELKQKYFFALSGPSSSLPASLDTTVTSDQLLPRRHQSTLPLRMTSISTATAEYPSVAMTAAHHATATQQSAGHCFLGVLTAERSCPASGEKTEFDCDLGFSRF